MVEISRYPLVMTHITMERSTIFNGKINYFDWAIFNSKLLNYQRVTLVGGAITILKNDGVRQWEG